MDDFNNVQKNPFNKEFTYKPTCPFCGLPIEKPKEINVRRPVEMPVGSCACGAVYAYDVTGYNQGYAFAEALVFSCNMNWDLAWDLDPEEDYQVKTVDNYDIESDLVAPLGVHQGRRVRGALYFIRLHKDIREVTQEGVQKRLKISAPVITEITVKKSSPKSFSKKDIEKMVKNYQMDQLVSIAGQDKRIIRYLQRLLYTGDELLRLRTAEILGKVSAVIAPGSPETISKLLQSQFTSLSDTGTSVWGAIDAAGEIIGNLPDLYAGYVPSLYRPLEDETIRPKILRALGKIAQADPDCIQKSTYFFMSFLQDPQPETRGYTAWLLGNLKAQEAKADLEQLQNDIEEITVYENGEISKKTVGQLAAEALQKL